MSNFSVQNRTGFKGRVTPSFNNGVFQGIKCLSTNADGLDNKMHELELLVAEGGHDVVVVTETLAKRQTQDKTIFNLPGYACFASDEGRGVCVFVKRNLEVTRVTEMEKIFQPAVFIRFLNLREQELILGAVYRSPNSSPEQNQKLNTLIEKCIPTNNKQLLVVTGDFNFPGIKWSVPTSCNSTDHPATKFLDIIESKYLCQKVTENTHHRAMQNPTMIDLVLTNDNERVGDIGYLPPLGKSHHAVLDFEVQVNVDLGRDETSEKTKYLVNKGDYEGMRSYIGGLPWKEKVSYDLDVDECWEVIKQELDNAIKKFVPTRGGKGRPKGRKSRPVGLQVPQTMLDKIRQKRLAYKRYKKYRSTENYNTYARARNQVKWESRKLTKMKEIHLAREVKNNPKVFYQYVSRKSKPKESVSNLRRADGSLTESNAEKAKVLNEFFSSVFTQEPDKDLPEFNLEGMIPEVSTVEISETQVKKALLNLKPAKSPGPDGIHPRYLRELASELAYPLKILFDLCIKKGKIPSPWKIAEVRPIFKKGSKSEPGNYRPVSLTSVICKVFETFIRDKLSEHITQSNLLYEHQFGFTKGRSCITQLLTTIFDWMDSLDDGSPVDVVYLDLRKAFDTVPHRRLFHKLEGYGIKGPLLSVVKDFLTGRSQYVSVNGQNSATMDVTSGVPQGSVLGPILFTYYINDMPRGIENLLKIFADDTKLYANVGREENKTSLQKDLDRLVQWTNDWLLNFNTGKCSVLHVGRYNKKENYTMKTDDTTRQTLKKTEAERDLGVMVDSELKFCEHVEMTVRKANQIAGLLMKTITYKSRDVMVPLFKSLVRSILEYGNPLWNPILKKHVNLIENVQRRFTRSIIGCQGLEYQERLKALDLPSLEFRRLRGDLIEVYKIMHGLYDPITTKSLFCLSKNTNTRGHNLKLDLRQTNTNLYHHFFTNRVIIPWNSLPPEVVNATSVNAFKNRLDDFYSDKFYATDLVF